MKRYFLYALILGCLGQSLISSASHSIGASSINVQLAKLGE